MNVKRIVNGIITKTTLLLLYLFAISLSPVCAEGIEPNDVIVDGIVYLLNPSSAVIKGIDPAGGSHEASGGVITIASSVSFNGKDYPVVSVGENAFQNCSDIVSVRLPESVHTIGARAFEGCTNLREINLPSDIKRIYECILDNTAWMEAQPDGLVRLGPAAITWKGTMAANSAFEIPDDISLIADYCFWNQQNLVSITIPQHVKVVGYKAFSNLYRATLDTEAVGDGFSECRWLKILELGPHVKRINNSAFKNCMALESVQTGGNVEQIGSYAFHYTAWKTNLKKQAKGLYYFDHVAWQYFGEMPEDYTVKLEDGVTQIAPNAFAFFNNLTHVILNDGLKYIGNHAFMDCTDLHEITLPSSLVAIEREAFTCPMEIHVNSLAQWNAVNKRACMSQYQLFVGGQPVASGSLPEGCSKVNDYAFSGCESIQDMSLPGSIKVIGADAFSNCRNLVSLTLPDGVEEIGSFALCNTGLSTLIIPQSVKLIGERPLYGCPNLTSLIILSSEVPNSVLNQYGRPLAIFKDELASQCTLYVPRGSKGNYEAEGWGKYFKDIMEINPDDLTAIRDISVSPDSGQVSSSKFQVPSSKLFDLSGRRLSAPPAKGVYLEDGRKRMVK